MDRFHELRIDKSVAYRIWDILIRECGARHDEEGWNRQAFVQIQAEGCSEYRFQGDLGFGGKFRVTSSPNRWHGQWYVDCYQEDENPLRKVMIEAANKALLELWAETHCKRCSNDLVRGFCKDQTCPFSSCSQNDERGWIGHPEMTKETNNGR